MATVLGVGLSEHHQLDIYGIAPQCLKALHQVINLIFRQRQAQLLVGLFKSATPLTENVHGLLRLWFTLGKQHRGIGDIIENRLYHAIVQLSFNEWMCGGVDSTFDHVAYTSLNARNLAQAGIMGNIGGFGGPRGNGAWTRNYDELLAADGGFVR